MSSKWDAVSSDDYLDEQEGYGRTVTLDCAECGAPVRVARADGPPIGRTRCTECRENAIGYNCLVDNTLGKRA